MARVWPTASSRNAPPSGIFLERQGYGAINRLTIANLQGRQAQGSNVIAKVRTRTTDAFGSYYSDDVTHDAESGRGRLQSVVRR